MPRLKVVDCFVYSEEALVDIRIKNPVTVPTQRLPENPELKPNEHVVGMLGSYPFTDPISATDTVSGYRVILLVEER